VERYESNGPNQNEFYKLHGNINYKFLYWLYKYGGQHSGRLTQTFHQIKVIPELWSNNQLVYSPYSPSKICSRRSEAGIQLENLNSVYWHFIHFKFRLFSHFVNKREFGLHYCAKNKVHIASIFNYNGIGKPVGSLKLGRIAEPDCNHMHLVRHALVRQTLNIYSVFSQARQS